MGQWTARLGDPEHQTPRSRTILTPTPGRKHRGIRSPPLSPLHASLVPEIRTTRLVPPYPSIRTSARRSHTAGTGASTHDLELPPPPSPKTPRESQNLLSSLNLVAMQSPAPLALGTEPDSPATADTASTDRYGAENSRCITPVQLSVTTSDAEALSCSTHSFEGVNATT